MYNLLSLCFLSPLVSFWSSQPFPFLGPGHTVALHSAVLLTHALGQDLDPGPEQDPGLTLFPPVDPAPVHVPMAGLIPAPLILVAMDAVMDDHVRGPALVQGLTGIGALAHHVLLCPTGEEAGRELKEQVPTGLGHGLAPLVVTGAAALVYVSHLLGSYHHTN